MATVPTAAEARPAIIQPSQTLFEAVSRKEYDTLADLYADNARRTIVSFLSKMEKSEEKCKEYLQQIACEGNKASNLGCNNDELSTLNARMLDDVPYNVALRDLGVFRKGPEHDNNNNCRESSFGQPSKKTPQKIDSRTTVAGAGDSDVDRLLWHSATIYSNSRPPSNFVVYNSKGDRQLNNHGREDGPPIFDGNVANATPPPLGRSGSSRGAGTILHLACALDAPLALAFLLAMGADARTSHTAFSRLMIHEAACNGSVECLTLLLELGQVCARGEEFPPATSHRTSQEMHFLAGKLEQQQQQQQREEMARIGIIHRYYSFLGAPSFPAKELPKGNFLQFLRLFREYYSMVHAGVVSEMNAARSALAYATLHRASRKSLARSCTFPRSETDPPRTILRPRGGCADRHGCTPLHWAAFRNETECVSLLLSYKADVNARAYPSGWTPLHDAAYRNSSESMALLMDAGAEVDARANSGATPLCFAAQEDACEAACLLLHKGADLAKCAGGPMRDTTDSLFGGQFPPLTNHLAQSRFSGYTPLHFCAHYNAHHAAGVLLKDPSAKRAMEIPDFNERLPIHVAVARGSSDVLRKLLHAGARVKIPRRSRNATAVTAVSPSGQSQGSKERRGGNQAVPMETPAPQPNNPDERDPISPLESNANTTGTSYASTTANHHSALSVSSPVLRDMIPSQPITSSKPWNCVTQRSIDECHDLLLRAEIKTWAPASNRHTLFVGNMDDERLSTDGVALTTLSVRTCDEEGWVIIVDSTADTDITDEVEV